MATENQFPTLRDLRDGLSRLVDGGMGDLPAQIVIVPGSTLVAIARVMAPSRAEDKTPLMIEFDAIGGRLPMMMLSADYLGSALPLATQ